MRAFNFFPVICFIVFGLLSCGKTPVHKGISPIPYETYQTSKDKSMVAKDVLPEFTAAPNEARIVVIKPDATLGELKDNIYVDGKYRSAKIGNTVLSLPVEAGEHLIVAESVADTGVKFNLKPGTVYYLIDPNDAESQKKLGDILYEKQNHDGALKAYREALKVDPAITGFYKRYAKLAIDKKCKVDEIIKALEGVIRSNEADINIYIGLAKIYQKKGDNKNAVEMYEKVLEFDPQNSEALQAIAECKAKLGDAKGAADAYKNVIKSKPEAVKEYKTLGDLYLKQQEKEKAMSAYRQYLDKGKGDQVVAKKIGAYYYNTKQYEDAAKYLAMVKGKQSQKFNHQLMLGYSYFNAGKYRKAITTFKGLNARNPKLQIRKDIIRKLAESYIQLNDHPKALFWFNKYSKLSRGKNADVSYLRAFLQEKTSPAKAKKIYESNIKSFPRDHRNFLRLGMMYSRSRKTLSKSATLLKKAANLVDTIPSVWLEIAKVYGKLRKTEDELKAYRKYIEADPQNLEANIRVGTILLDKGKVREGMGYLETAHKKSPDNMKTIVGLSTGYISTNRLKEAIDLLSKGKVLKPDDLMIRKKLFEAYREMGQEQQALDEIKQLLEIKRDNESLLLYAQLVMKSGDLADAENAIEDIRATDPENIEALMMLASIYLKNKKYADAIDVYKEVLMIDARNAPALNGQAEIHLLQNKVLWAEKFYERALKADQEFALAELGLAKIALLRKNNAKYKKHLERAYFLDPNDPSIKKEYKKAKQ